MGKIHGIEGHPLFVVATEEQVWDTTSRDWVPGPLQGLIDRLRPGERIYLVHLDSRSPDGRVKVTDLFATPSG